MVDTIRAFIAIELSKEIKVKLGVFQETIACTSASTKGSLPSEVLYFPKRQERLKKSGADVNPVRNINTSDDKNKISNGVKWVKPDGIHLTLKFLGNIPTSKISLIKEVLDSIAKETVSFQIALSKIGAFPKIDYPRVIWVGLEEGKDKTIELNRKLEERLEKIGFPKESRSFQPHLTLGRVKSSKNKGGLKKSIELLNRDLPPLLSCESKKGGAKMTVSEIKLFKSTLTPKGAIYTCLCQATFA